MTEGELVCVFWPVAIGQHSKYQVLMFLEADYFEGAEEAGGQ